MSFSCQSTHFNDTIHRRRKRTTAHTVEPANETQVLPNVKLSIERIVFGKVADDTFNLLRITTHVKAFNQYASRRWWKVRRRDLHRGRLASAIRSEKSYDLSAPHFERDVVDSTLSSVDLGEVPDLQRHS